jgi:uncharacterized protein
LTPSDTLVVVMCKTPVRGLVKTRLAADVGDDAALAVYSELLDYVLDRLHHANVHVAVFVEGGELDSRFRGKNTWQFFTQRGSDLGERIISALHEAPCAEKMLVIGTDMPFIDATLLTQAAAALDHADVVIGPCVDGGYYLIGMKRVHEELFEGIPWSTADVLASTLGRCAEHRLTSHILPLLRDVDTLDDLLALQAPSQNHAEVVERLHRIVKP